MHRFDHAFANSSVLIAQLIYPVDVFVLLQPYADQLGLSNWDMDDYEVQLFLMKKGSNPHEDEEKQLSSLLESQIKLDGVRTAQLERILHEMSRRAWIDVIFIRDVSKEKLGQERELWNVMDGISDLALTE